MCRWFFLVEWYVVLTAIAGEPVSEGAFVLQTVLQCWGALWWICLVRSLMLKRIMLNSFDGNSFDDLITFRLTALCCEMKVVWATEVRVRGFWETPNPLKYLGKPFWFSSSSWWRSPSSEVLPMVLMELHVVMKGEETPGWCLFLTLGWFLGIQEVTLPPGARVRPSTNHWVSYQPTIGYLTNQLLGILPTNYWVSYQPTIGCLTNQLTTFLLSIFPPPWQPMLLMIQVQVQHSFYQFSPPLGNPCLVLGFTF